MNVQIIGLIGKEDICQTAAQIIQCIDVHKRIDLQASLEDVLKSYLNPGRPWDDDCMIVAQSKWKQKQFGMAPKQICSILTGIPVKEFNDPGFMKAHLPRQWDVPIGMWPGEENPLTPQHFIKLIKRELKKNIHPDMWINAMFTLGTFPKNSSTLPFWIITDVQTSEEIDAIKNRAGIIVEIYENNAEISQWRRRNLTDYHIENNGSIEELTSYLQIILKDIA